MEIQEKYKINAKQIRNKYKKNTKRIRNKYKTITTQIRNKYRINTTYIHVGSAQQYTTNTWGNRPAHGTGHCCWPWAPQSINSSRPAFPKPDLLAPHIPSLPLLLILIRI